MPVELTWDPEVDPGLFARLVALWVEVTNAGGSVGFVGPVVAADVGPTAQRALATVAEGADRLLVAHDGPRLVGALFVCSAQFHLMEHWRTLKRLMVSPGAQRGGVGSLLLAAAAGEARASGWSGLRVTVRGEMGLETFYERNGYREVGRLPGAIRVGPGDDRDEVTMWLALDR